MENIIYIVIGIIIFVWQIIKEAQKARLDKQHIPSPPENRPDQSTSHTPARGRSQEQHHLPPPTPGKRETQQPKSFEELLRESREQGKKTYEEKIKPPVTRSIRKAEKVKEVTKAIVDEEAEALKKIRKDLELAEALNKSGIPLPEEIALDTTKRKTANKYAALLHNKQDLKTMIVVSEILNRKY